MFDCKSLVLLIAACLLAGASARAAEVAPRSDTGRAYDQAVGKAVEYFRAKGQAADGSFSAEVSPAITALVTTAVLRTGRSLDDPLVAKSLKYLEGLVHPDGGIYVENSRHQNYETCIALQCFSAANQDKRYDSLLKNAEIF